MTYGRLGTTQSPLLSSRKKLMLVSSIAALQERRRLRTVLIHRDSYHFLTSSTRHVTLQHAETRRARCRWVRRLYRLAESHH